MSGEWFDILDKEQRVIGKALRSVCHSHSGLLHGAVHVLVFDSKGRLFLQRRSMKKDLQPGSWDTSVGGHLHPGESPAAGALREMKEELGVAPAVLHPAYQYVWQSTCETELITAFATVHEGPFNLCPEEITEGRFWERREIAQSIENPGFPFTPQFRQEFTRVESWLASEGGAQLGFHP